MLRWRHGSQNLADAGCAAADDWEPGTPQPMRKTFKLMVCCFALSHVLGWRYCRSAHFALRMILSENRVPLFGIMRCEALSHVLILALSHLRTGFGGATTRISARPAAGARSSAHRCRPRPSVHAKAFAPWAARIAGAGPHPGDSTSFPKVSTCTCFKKTTQSFRDLRALQVAPINRSIGGTSTVSYCGTAGLDTEPVAS
jgi:hypothetical protein